MNRPVDNHKSESINARDGGGEKGTEYKNREGCGEIINQGLPHIKFRETD